MKSSLRLLVTICLVSTSAIMLQSCVSVLEKGTSPLSSSLNATAKTIVTRSTGKRVALVIGNNHYTHIDPLNNPINDATDIANSLKELGFDVILKTDANKLDMATAIKAFEQRTKGANVTMLYYSGHGLQVDGENILVPIDYKGAKEEGISANFAQKVMQDATRGTKILVLDACRNNPFSSNVKITEDSKALKKMSRSSGKGLAPIVKTDEFYVAYATAAGETASDGNGRNSPYTAALLAHIKQPIPIEILFKQVRTSVKQNTNPPQVPAEYSSLTGNFCFAGCGVEITDTSNTCRINIGQGIYEGECQDGKANGQGVQRYADGEYYTGSFQNNLRNGYGTQYLKSGGELAGNWQNGRFIGK